MEHSATLSTFIKLPFVLVMLTLQLKIIFDMLDHNIWKARGVSVAEQAGFGMA